MKQLSFQIDNKNLFQEKLLYYFRDFKHIVFLNSNSSKENYFAVSENNSVSNCKWKFGFISYDYKNQIENLISDHDDFIQFPDKYFFSPELLFIITDRKVEVVYSTNNIDEIISAIENSELPQKENNSSIQVNSRIPKAEYLKKVDQLKKHIQIGDIYEVNFCQEFYAENIKVNPVELYFKLNHESPTPFSCFVKHNDQYLLCASPERFIHKKGDKILSQPIKGTIKRGTDDKEDKELKKQLYNDPKERSENVMIVDLVRNDLSKVAERGSVNVDELYGIYTFPQVHQMISTVSAKVKKEVDFNDIIYATFPMGSMTGAPKVRAMELIEEYENTKRGLYSGTVGYINENGDFDFNVVIRSITYNEKNNYLSFIVGGAITNQSIPEKEYEECLLKAKAMIKTLSN